MAKKEGKCYANKTSNTIQILDILYSDYLSIGTL